MRNVMSEEYKDENEVKDEAPLEEEPVEETIEPADEQPVEESVAPAQEQPVTAADEVVAPQKTSRKTIMICLLVGTALLVAAAVVACVIWLCGDKGSKHNEVTTVYGDVGYLVDEANFDAQDASVLELSDYSVPDALPNDETMRTVVARGADGEYVLTNADLQIYYWSEYMSFMNSYGAYASYLGLDTTKPLAQQTAMQEGYTWEQFFLESGLNGSGMYYALAQAAKAAEYTLSEEAAAEIADVTDPNGTFATQVLEAGYTDTADFVSKTFGAGAALKNYQNYLETYMLAVDYYSNVMIPAAEATVDDAAAEAYYDENAATYAEGGVLKVNDVDVRHILIQPEGEQDEEGNYSEEAWEAAKEEADRIYALWQESATEDNFAALAQEYSTDEGSKADGGLYENVFPTQMTTEFNDWIFDESRVAGNTDIVKTAYGYHIMYFVGEAETKTWLDNAKTDMTDEALSAAIDELMVQYPLQFNYAKMRLYDMVSANLVTE
ncbi:MAG: peptidyl-prolyl cis-trans isomerase [Oscillospiraceae bacterium]|nr:peptidyl-prolyl cis-trans isomerase [Oscillospiraceae bacterium]